MCGKDACDRVVLGGQLVHRAKLVSAMRVDGAGTLDELGHEVDAGRVDVHRTEMFREVPGAAPDVEHFAGPNRQVASDERQVVHMYLGSRAEALDVERRMEAVRVPNLIHAAGLYGRNAPATRR